MGVYQSKTEPKVRKRTYRETVPGNIVESMGKRYLIKWMRLRGGIPVRVQPEQRMGAFGWEFRFDWYEVTTD